MSEVKKENKLTAIKSLCYFYISVACLGGAIFGFLSFGTVGLFIGLSMAALVSITLKKGIRILDEI